jgi:hypothetical protein
MSDNFTYKVEPCKDVWRVTAVDSGSEELVVMCFRKTEAEAWATVRYLQMDDDKFDVIDGAPRKYQS